MKVCILYHRFLDDAGNNRLIGGIQTYIYNLARVCHENMWEPIIFQSSANSFTKIVDGIKIIGVKRDNNNTFQGVSKMYQCACEAIDTNKDIIIFGADHCSVKTKSNRCILIQHGISWDLPVSFFRQDNFLNKTLIGKFFWKAKAVWDAKKAYENCKNRVCVDYNFLNWYKTILTGKLKGNNWVIPNFSVIPERQLINHRVENDETTKILFARRFTEYRGTRIMSEAAINILKDYKNVEFTFAGEGPDESWLREQFKTTRNVQFIKYLPNESQKIHSAHHISIIPSLASEGTSLSVAEAMSVGSLVIASSVGGITNMIIDNFNGILISPDANAIYNAIKSVLENPNKRIEISHCGYESAKKGFSIEVWKSRWVDVIKALEIQV